MLKCNLAPSIVKELGPLHTKNDSNGVTVSVKWMNEWTKSEQNINKQLDYELEIAVSW